MQQTRFDPSTSPLVMFELALLCADNEGAPFALAPETVPQAWATEHFRGPTCR